MDPDCAICASPASMACDCEAKGLERAVKQAEQRIMSTMYSDIRTWVRQHAQDYILEYFALLTERRKDAHAQHVDDMTQRAFHYYNAPPHPNEIAHAQAALKRGIDEDWRSSVQRYPEVLEYFFGLVELSYPGDNEPAVKDPPLSALRKNHGRRSSTVAPESMRDRERSRRTPPPIMDRRTPGPMIQQNPLLPVQHRMEREGRRRGYGRTPTAPPPESHYYYPH